MEIQAFSGFSISELLGGNVQVRREDYAGCRFTNHFCERYSERVNSSRKMKAQVMRDISMGHITYTIRKQNGRLLIHRKCYEISYVVDITSPNKPIFITVYLKGEYKFEYGMYMYQ